MSAEIRSRGDVAPLTKEQRQLVDSEPDLPMQAMAHVIQEWGLILPKDDLMVMAIAGVDQAARTWNPAGGAPFRQWAFYRTTEDLIDAARAERRHRRLLAAMRGEMFRRLRTNAPFSALDDAEASAPGDVSRFAAGMADWMVGAAWDAEGGAGELVDATRTAIALRTVVDSLKPWQRRVLALRFVEEEDVKRIAKEENIDYRALLRRIDKLMQLLRARLGGLGIQSMPAWFTSGGPTILGEPANENEKER